MLTTLVFILPFLVFYTIMVVYAERKISAFIQDRLGPMEVGYYGLLQTVADLAKLLQKEDLVPATANRFLFKAAPVIIFVPIFSGFSVLPLSAGWSVGFSSALFFLLAIISLDVIGIVIAGWASNNKYSMLGTMRSVAQIISYEVPLSISILCVCILAQSLDLQEISFQQGILSNNTVVPLLGIKGLPDVAAAGGMLTWNVFRMPVLFVAWIIFFIASLAESNRAPFDLPEAESELVAGYQTEYSGFRWAVIMLAEYAMMLLVSFVGVILFWGSWNTPLPNIGAVRLADWTTGQPGSISIHLWGIFWLVLKTCIMVALQIWVRWTYPRVRIDQLTSLSWKFLTPIAFILLMICALWKLWLL
ncbi:MAG: NADH-quinone oxidoreductase subunit H [Cyclobacteriaceae bacterium]|nr:NADH-quinone oxidoreductase subunit H [Cyclobacteriaceae bacterium]